MVETIIPIVSAIFLLLVQRSSRMDEANVGSHMKQRDQWDTQWNATSEMYLKIHQS
jgi:hypothetical protein